MDTHKDDEYRRLQRIADEMTQEKRADDEAAAILARFRSALAQGPLTISVEGAGVPSKQTLTNPLTLIVDRRDVEAVVTTLLDAIKQSDTELEKERERFGVTSHALWKDKAELDAVTRERDKTRQAITEIRNLADGYEDSFARLEGDWPEMGAAIRALYAFP